MKQYRIGITTCLLILLAFWAGSALEPAQTEQEFPSIYPVRLGDGSRVYDGDTIQDVFIEIKTFRSLMSHDPKVSEFDVETLWPGILYNNGILYVVTDIRINGIDTPEKRPVRKGRTVESLLREKAAASAAQKALSGLIEAHDLEFEIVDPQLGKYAGRIVADVFVGKGDGRISVAEYLIEKGHAKPYDGGTKVSFDDWYQRDKE